ncbi:MAG: dicarboxylate/amino acid:cation symporter [Bacteroidaceae bacterium]|nr:dicarboxylate/amino acid:cation symporter [Bacteroidaceae bacterium]
MANDMVDIKKSLEDYKIDSHEQYLAELLLEEVEVQLTGYEANGYKCCNKRKTVGKRMGNVFVQYKYEGDKLNVVDLDILASAPDDISKRILNTYRNKFSHEYRGRTNTININVHRNQHLQLYFTLASILGGIVVGLLLQFMASEEVVTTLRDSFFQPVTTIFIRLMKMVVAPVVLFSIMGSFANVTNLSAYGSIGLKIVGAYMFTTIVACILGLGFGQALLPAVELLPLNGVATAIESQAGDISVGRMFLDIFPDNVVSPISDGNMLQLLFVALVFGVAVSMISERVPLVRGFITELNELSGKVITFILKLVPVMAFCSMASLFSSVKASMLSSCVYLFVTPIAGLVAMIAIYLLMIALVGRTSPMSTIKALPALMVVPFTTASSAASIANTISVADKLGIPSRISSFSIPLGATINMDGLSFYLPAYSLIFAAMAGVNIDSGILMSLLTMCIVLSVATPGVPGAGLPIMAILMELTGTPLEYFSLYVAVYPLVDPIVTSANVVGDLCVTQTIAASGKSKQ